MKYISAIIPIISCSEIVSRFFIPYRVFFFYYRAGFTWKKGSNDRIS